VSHLVTMTLERYVADDLPATERDAADVHLRECDACAQKVATLRADQAALLAEVPPARFVMQVAARKARSARRRYLVAPLALAAAAGLALFVLPRDGVRVKGRSLVVSVQRDGATHVLAADERVAAGDRLQLALSGAGQASAWMVDANGRVDRLTDAPMELDAVVRPLPTSAVIESPCVDAAIVVADADRGDEAVRALAKAPGRALVRTLRCR